MTPDRFKPLLDREFLKAEGCASGFGALKMALSSFRAALTVRLLSIFSCPVDFVRPQAIVEQNEN